MTSDEKVTESQREILEVFAAARERCSDVRAIRWRYAALGLLAIDFMAVLTLFAMA